MLFMSPYHTKSPQSSFFNRDDQALTGFGSYFKKKSDEEREHGVKLAEYQAKRGGMVVYQVY